MLGCIIYNRKIDTLDFIETKNSLDLNTKIPTLIIGWNNAKKIINEDLNILNKKIKDNVFWTFSKTEKRIDYENDVLNFYKFVYNNAYNNISYKYIDFLTENYSTYKFLIKILKDSKIKVFYTINNCIYLSYENYVYGFDIKNMKYANINLFKIRKLLKSNKNNIFLKNSSFLKSGTIRLLNNNNIIIPYLYKMKYYNNFE